MARFENLFTSFGSPTLVKHFADSVIFRRGELTSDAFEAQWEEPEPDVAFAEDAGSAADRRRYLLPAASVVLAGSAVRPQQGDEVLQTVNGTQRVYEIMPFAETRAVYLDETGTDYICEAKRTK